MSTHIPGQPGYVWTSTLMDELIGAVELGGITIEYAADMAERLGGKREAVMQYQHTHDSILVVLYLMALADRRHTRERE